MSVLNHLQNLGNSLILKSYEKENIRSSIDTIDKRLKLHFGTIQEKFVFGSFDRETILPHSVDDNSDIDFMVVFKDGNTLRPQTLLNRLRGFVEYYYNRSEIYQSSPTIVLKLNHIKFELVPAYKNFFGNYHIPAPAKDFTEWVSTDPEYIKTKLNNKHKNNGFEIKKLVRILKYWNVLNDRVYNSYDLEEDIIDTFYIFCYNLKDYFYDAVNSINTYDLPKNKIAKVNHLQNIIRITKEFESKGLNDLAEKEIKKVLP